MTTLSAEALLARIAGDSSLACRGQEGAPLADDVSAGCAQIVHVERLPERQARYASPSPPLPEQLSSALASIGIGQLYSHQVEAIERVRAGEDVVVVTATSSGKTLCYNLPILEGMLQDREARALYIYPINALVNDQLKGLMRLNLSLGREAAGIARYTGSLNSDQRRAIRTREPNIILTNPEMIHLSFLLWHQNWESLWRNLRYIVIDEVHTYRGVFGSNMAQLFRRVLRMAAHYGSHPRFVCCSATIANPGELAEALTGRRFSVVDSDGAGRGARHFVLWNPPLANPAEDPSLRRSYAEEAVGLMQRCIAADYNTIVFARARSLTERMLRLAQGVAGPGTEGEEQSAPLADGLGDRIASYRAGYLAAEREEIENRLKSGELQGVITTNALELGIDIGDLDAAIIAGYPGTIMSTWQQAGRAGRRGRDSLVFMVASQNPLDQYYVNHPEEFFAQPHELAVVDLENQPIALKHLLCAARELPFAPEELDALPASRREAIAELRKRAMLAPSPGDEAALAYPEERRDIHFRISLRSAGHETYRILDEDNNEVGTIEPPNVFREAHPGAIYQHAGDDYRVTFLDRKSRVVRVREEHLPHYTRAFSTLKLDVLETYASRTISLGGLPFTVSMGDLLVEERVRSYQELVLGSDELVKQVNLSYPLSIRLHTTGMWIHLPTSLRAEMAPPVGGQSARASETDGDESVDPDDPYDHGLHAVQHLLASVLPLLVMCDRRDIGGYYQMEHPDVGGAAVFVYDSFEGGIGLSEIAYEGVEELLALARDTVAQCGCLSGCPSCIQWGACRMHNEGLDKGAALQILSRLAGIGPRVGPTGPRRQRLTMQTRSRRDEAGPVEERHGLDLTLRAIEELDALTVRVGLSFNPAKEEAPVEQLYAPGDAVVHSSYGRGTVVASRLDGPREWVKVRFLRRGMLREIEASKGMLRKPE